MSSSEVMTPSKYYNNRRHNNQYNSGNNHKHKKVVPFSLFIVGLVIFFVLGIAGGFGVCKVLSDLEVKKEEPISKYDVSEALLKQQEQESAIEIVEPEPVVEEPTPTPIVEEPVPEEIEEEVEEEVEEEEIEEEPKNVNFEYYKNEIESSLEFTTAFAFSMKYKGVLGSDTPRQKNYSGAFVKSDDINAINGFLCTELYSDSNYEMLGLVDEPDTTTEDLGLLLFKDEYIKDITPVAAGYEVFISISDKNLEGEYTVIYDNYQLSGIMGKLNYVEPKVEEPEEEENQENSLNTENEEQTTEVEETENEQEEEQEEEPPIEKKSYTIVINNIQHL